MQPADLRLAHWASPRKTKLAHRSAGQLARTPLLRWLQHGAELLAHPRAAARRHARTRRVAAWRHAAEVACRQRRLLLQQQRDEANHLGSKSVGRLRQWQRPPQNYQCRHCHQTQRQHPRHAPWVRGAAGRTIQQLTVPACKQRLRALASRAASTLLAAGGGVVLGDDGGPARARSGGVAAPHASRLAAAAMATLTPVQHRFQTDLSSRWRWRCR